MRTGVIRSLAVAAAAACVAGAARAQTPRAGHEEDVKRDLLSVITLEGKPCGEVVRVERKGENDYLATCKTGDRYHVYVGAKDRVVVEPR